MSCSIINHVIIIHFVSCNIILIKHHFVSCSIISSVVQEVGIQATGLYAPVVQLNNY